MTAKWIEWIVGSLDEKKQYREYKARVAALPAPYRDAARAVERYLLYAGGVGQSDALLRMCDDLADLFEQSAQAGTPVREIVGDDPVEFVETFIANYADGQWQRKERDRLTKAIEDAEREERP